MIELSRLLVHHHLRLQDGPVLFSGLLTALFPFTFYEGWHFFLLEVLNWAVGSLVGFVVLFKISQWASTLAWTCFQESYNYSGCSCSAYICYCCGHSFKWGFRDALAFCTECFHSPSNNTGFCVPKRTAYWEFDVVCGTVGENICILWPSWYLCGVSPSKYFRTCGYSAWFGTPGAFFFCWVH